MRRFVLDASVSLAWFIENPMPSYAIRVRRALVQGDRAVVPALWSLEMANGFANAERRRLLTADEAGKALNETERLLTQVIESMDFVSMRQAFTTAGSFQLSASDAVYLELARREAIPLATLDRRLLAGARQAGVPSLF